MAGFIGLYIIYFGFIRHSHIPAYMYVIFLFTLLMLGYHAFCPGNAARKVTETAACYPAYETFTIPDKLVLGITSTISYGLLKPFYVVFFFNIALLINIYRKKRINLDFIVMSGFTVVNLAISVSDTPRLHRFLRPLLYIFESFIGALDSMPYSSMRLYAVILYFTVFIAFIIYALWKYQPKPVFILTGIILAAAFCARILLGFSASVHESGMRTFINSFILIITAGLFCLFPDRFNEHIQKQE